MRVPVFKLGGKKHAAVSPEQEQGILPVPAITEQKARKQVESAHLMNSPGEAIELSDYQEPREVEDQDGKTEDDAPCELEEEAPMTLEEALRELHAARAQIAKLQKQLKAQKERGLEKERAMYPPEDSHGRDPGVGSLEEYMRTSVFRILMQRLPWLLVLLVLQSCSALILHSADRMIEKHLVIAYFVPMVVGTGGNAGNQPGVMVTRALSIHRATDAPFPIWRLLFKEIGLGLISAMCVALTAFFRVLVEFPSEPTEAIAIALAMFLVVLIAIALGILFSWGLERCSCDPAAGSAPLLTTVSDLMGIGILTGLAYGILG